MSEGNTEELLGRTSMREVIDLHGDLIQILETLSVAAFGDDTRLLSRRFLEFEVRERRLDRCLVECVQTLHRVIREVASETGDASTVDRIAEDLDITEQDLAPSSIGATVSRVARRFRLQGAQDDPVPNLGLRLAGLCASFDSGDVSATEFAEKVLEFQDELHERRSEWRQVIRTLKAARSGVDGEATPDEVKPPCLALGGASISCRGKSYPFTGPVQRQVMALLFAEWERHGKQDGKGAVTEDCLHVELDRESSAQSTRVAKLFRHTPDVREILVRVAPLTWALFLTGDPPKDPGW